MLPRSQGSWYINISEYEFTSHARILQIFSPRFQSDCVLLLLQCDNRKWLNVCRRKRKSGWSIDYSSRYTKLIDYDYLYFNFNFNFYFNLQINIKFLKFPMLCTYDLVLVSLTDYDISRWIDPRIANNSGSVLLAIGDRWTWVANSMHV